MKSALSHSKFWNFRQNIDANLDKPIASKAPPLKYIWLKMLEDAGKTSCHQNE